MQLIFSINFSLKIPFKLEPCLLHGCFPNDTLTSNATNLSDFKQCWSSFVALIQVIYRQKSLCVYIIKNNTKYQEN